MATSVRRPGLVRIGCLVLSAGYQTVTGEVRLARREFLIVVMRAIGAGLLEDVKAARMMVSDPMKSQKALSAVIPPA